MPNRFGAGCRCCSGCHACSLPDTLTLTDQYGSLTITRDLSFSTPTWWGCHTASIRVGNSCTGGGTYGVCAIRHQLSCPTSHDDGTVTITITSCCTTCTDLGNGQKCIKQGTCEELLSPCSGIPLNAPDSNVLTSATGCSPFIATLTGYRMRFYRCEISSDHPVIGNLTLTL